MLKQMEIKNFRCFTKLTVEDLAPVNLVVGKNSVGKTALLEAAMLMYGPNNPATPTELNRLRQHAVPIWDFENSWGWLFKDKDATAKINISSIDEAGVSRSLAISMQEPDDTELIELDIDPRVSAAREAAIVMSKQPRRELHLVFTEADKAHESRARVAIKGDELQLLGKRAKIDWKAQSAFQTRETAIDKGVLTAFSALKAQKDTKPLIDALKGLEPRLVDLDVLETSGGRMLFADLGGSKLVPLSMMGEGITHVVCVLTHLYSTDGGLFCVDGIDEGLHYSAFQGLWKCIAAATKKGVQVIATAHSWDCVRAAHEVFQDDANYPFRLVRLERSKADVVAVTHDKEMVEIALNLNLEMR